MYMSTHSRVKPIEAGKWCITQIQSVIVVSNRIGYFRVNTSVIGVGADPFVSTDKALLSSLPYLAWLHGCGSGRVNDPV